MVWGYLGFCLVGTRLDGSPRFHLVEEGTQHTQAWEQQIIYCCLHKAGGKDEECLSQSIGGENLCGNTYREVMPVWFLQRARGAQLLLPQKSSPPLSQGCRAVPPAKEQHRNNPSTNSPLAGVSGALPRAGEG